MACSNCGTPNPGTGKFCINCGYPLAAPLAAAATSTIQEPIPPAAAPALRSAPEPKPVVPSAGGPAVAPFVPTKVTVTDVSMPFGSMVVFMIKWAIASIPAIIILFVLMAIVSAIFGGIFGGIFGALLNSAF